MNQPNKQSFYKPHLKKLLNDFSIDLYDHMQQINTRGNKKKKQNSLHGNNSQQFLLPSINREKNSSIIRKVKKNGSRMPSIQCKAHKLLVRINQLQKNNENFWQNKQQKIQVINSMCSTPRQKNIYPIIQIPPTIYYNINQFPILPPQPSQSQHYSPKKSYQNANKNLNTNIKIQKVQIKKNSFVITQERARYLRWRIKIVFISILFIFVFKTYARTMLYKRCLDSLQLQQIVINQSKQLQSDLFKCFQKIDIYKIFTQSSKKKQGSEKQINQITIEHKNEQILIDLDVCEQFLKEYLIIIQSKIKNGEFNIFKPIIASFLDGSFPLSRVFLQQQMQLVKIHQQFGYFTIQDEISRIFIINYFFIKVFIANMLIGKKLQSVLLKIYKKNMRQQKLAILFGKKLTIILVLLYDILNSIYFQSLKKIVNGYKLMPSNKKIIPLNELVYEFNLNNFIPKQLSKSLIKGIQCPQDLRILFIQKFDKNWIIIKNITELLLKSGKDYKRIVKLKTLEEVKFNPFPQRGKLLSIFQQRFIKINRGIDSQQRSNQSQSSYYYQNKNTLKNIVKKKK